MSVGQAPADLGAKLHLARERRGVSLRQIANSTKISIGILEALESNDLSRLPAGFYGRGFVRSFATEVGLDPDAAVAEFVAQFPPDSVTAVHPTSERIEKDQAFETHRLIGSTFLRLTAVSIPIAAFVVYVGARGRQTEHAPVQARANIVASQAVSTEPSAGLAPAAIPEPPLTLPPATPAETPRDVPTAAVPRAPEVAVSSEGAPAEPESSAGAKSEKSGVGEPVADRLRVALSVTRSSWVIATVDGKKTVNRLFEVGEQETLEVRRDLVLTAGDAGALVMTLNGIEAKSLGGGGETVTTRVNRSNFKNYLALP
jgi:cytoskeleton protein RodZ